MLPEGPGLAALYPGDVGIAAHPSVLFNDRFDTYRAGAIYTDMVDRGPYSNVYQQDLMSFPEGSLQIRHQPGRYNNIDLRIAGVDVVHVRAVMKLSPGFKWQLDGNGYASSAHVGISISASYDGAGVRPNGTNHFMALFEPTRYLAEAQPGYLHAYCYHMNQGGAWGDHLYSDGRKVPEGSRWTPSADFVPRPVRQPPLGEWFTVEMRGEANTPGQRNGRVTVWLNGEIISDISGIQFRSTSSLKWDLVQIGLGQGNLGGSLPAQSVWFDNLVVATEYIGPLASDEPDPEPEEPEEPTVVELAALLAALQATMTNVETRLAALEARPTDPEIAARVAAMEAEIAALKDFDQRVRDL